ncbi:SUR7/PalI family-domain-containing protein [Fennellomyces sp. T-0311]|nr:SUR7/PalI family-domain-containing protein [Fennellomyces sp. T-0311]
MLFKCCALLGSLFLLFSFLLHLFPMIGQLSNRQFLRHMYFQQAYNRPANSVYQNGLWNYCSGTLQGIESCSSPHQSYNWGNTPVIGQMVPQQYQPNGGHFRHLFTGLFALTMAGTVISFLLWLMSLPIMFCCGRRSHRAPGIFMSTMTFTNFLVTIAAIILALILAISTNKGLTDGWQGRAGNSIWSLLGAMGALLIGFMCFNGTCCGRRTRVADPELGPRKPGMFSKPTAHAPPPPPGPGMSRPFQMPN